MRHRLLSACVAVGAATVLVTGQIHAATAEEESEQLIRRGIVLRKSAHDDEAFEAFRAAYKAHPTPRAQAQMGLAEHAIGRWVDAERNLSAALATETDPWISKNALTIRQSLAAVGGHLGSLQISGSPAGARVTVDEREVGKLPLSTPVRVPSGEILVTVSATGFIEINRKLTVPTGSLVRDVIALHPAPQRPAVTYAESSPPPAAAFETSDGVERTAGADSVASSARPAQHDTPSQSPSPGLSRAQRWSLAVGALGLAAVGLGTVLTLQAVSRNNASKSGCQGDACDPAGSQARREALTYGNRATTAFVAGGVLLGAGLAIFLLGRPPAESSYAMRFMPVAEPGRIGAVGSLSF